MSDLGTHVASITTSLSINTEEVLKDDILVQVVQDTVAGTAKTTGNCPLTTIL
jgi:hypothetical protein